MTKRVNKLSLTVIIILLIAGMIAFPQIKKHFSKDDSIAETRPAGPQRSSTLNINAAILKKQLLTEKNICAGSTIPDEEVNLSFEASGKVVEIHFMEGTHVEKGALLAKINDKPLQAELKKLEAQLPLAKERVFRQGSLLKKDAVSQEAYEQVTTEHDKLLADIDLVKAMILQTELRAPFDGIIGLRLVSEGAYVSPSTVIANLTKITPLKIEFSIPEKYSNDVKNGTTVKFSLESQEGKLKQYSAKVYAVEGKVDWDTRSLKVRAIFPNENQEIFPGRYLSVEISRNEIKDAITVPSEAIIPEMGRSIVYKYNNGKAQEVEIIAGIRTESEVQILEGFREGDTAIISGVMQLRSGMNVVIDNLKQE